jgi:hypothetical protein
VFEWCDVKSSVSDLIGITIVINIKYK